MSEFPWAKKLSDKFHIPKERLVESVLTGVQNGDSIWMSDWKLVSSGNSRKTPSPPPADLQLQNRVSAPVEDEGLGSMSNEESELAETELCSSNKVRW